ncbi:hypothetical protein [Cetobacterium sp.]|uniref:hypothetical protein n=1 Tax=Cetobacterium sp. TaxID=2071632 RepID=UPI003F379B08
MLITRNELLEFSDFVKKEGLEEKFAGDRVYLTSIWFEDSLSAISWDDENSDEVLQKVLLAINSIYDLDLQLGDDYK